MFRQRTKAMKKNSSHNRLQHGLPGFRAGCLCATCQRAGKARRQREERNEQYRQARARALALPKYLKVK